MAEIDFSGWNMRQDEGYPFAQAVTDLSAKFPHYAPIIHAYDIDWEDSITGIIPQTVDIVRRLKQSGYRLVGLTNWNMDKFTLVKHKYDFFNLFEQIIVSGAVKLVKPDPAIYNLLLQQVSLTAADCLMIDNSSDNVQASRKLGFLTIHFTSPEQLEAELLRLNVL